ncbi:hypothetical protein [Micromonospora inaquosa]|uniref:Uncharacterized protein n=1 Tax=Micromonospora inaquosa TaxID=2203716 RepID=A0A3N9W2G3_9ACTN|nr:hypothetical protein [Micromonospora inaquosa]RQW94915.1 hypothetical protein DLJ59_33805 [Micromonospora inaquosa]
MDEKARLSVSEAFGQVETGGGDAEGEQQRSRIGQYRGWAAEVDVLVQKSAAARTSTDSQAATRLARADSSSITVGRPAPSR